MDTVGTIEVYIVSNSYGTMAVVGCRLGTSYLSLMIPLTWFPPLCGRHHHHKHHHHCSRRNHHHFLSSSSYSSSLFNRKTETRSLSELAFHFLFKGKAVGRVTFVVCFSLGFSGPFVTKSFFLFERFHVYVSVVVYT